MTNIRVKFLLVAVLAICDHAASQTQWECIAPNPPRLPQTYSTAVVGTKAYLWCDGNNVFSSSDTGRTFTAYPQYGPTDNTANGFYPMQGIAFADSLVGYIVDLAHGEFRTTDGGWTWTRKGQPGSNTVLVAFGSSRVGWKVGWAGFYRTIDAGATWTFISSPLLTWEEMDGNFSKICALDANNLWVLKTYQLAASKPGPLWHSTNSGASWTNIQVGLSSDSMNQIQYEDLVMKPSGYGCIVGTIYTPSPNFDNIRAVVLMTTDFGATWVSKEFIREDYSDIISISDSVWVLLGNTRPHSYDPWGQGVTRRTTDAGNTWVFSNAFGPMQNLHFYKSVYLPRLNSIIAATTQGVYRSTDGGRSFPKVTSERDMLVSFVTVDRAASSTSDQAIVCPSYGLDCLISPDGGSSWDRKRLPGYLMATMKDVRVTNKKIYEITYDYQVTFTLASSTDFGESWTSTSVPASGALRGLAVSGTDTVVMQAYPNMVLSTDGGKRWSQAPMAGSFWVNETEILGGRKIIAVGGFYDTSSTKGMIYVSTDAGFNWRIQDFPAELNELKMITESTGFAIGDDAKLYRTTDGGDTWKATISGVSSVAFFDSQRGVASDLQMTTDGGATWKPSGIPFPFRSGFTSMEFNRGGDLFVSAAGNLFRYSNAISVFPAASPTNQEACAVISLEQNYPNPFNPSTTIRYTLPHRSHVSLTVYNTLGQRVAILVNGEMDAGYHSVQFSANGGDAGHLASGVYFYRLQANGFVMSRKLMLVK